MFKNVKKVLFALVLALTTAFVFACTEPNKENCKEYCDQCTELNKENCKEFCDTCTPANKENCNEYCETCPAIDKEACQEFQDYVAPKSFYADGTTVAVGESDSIYIEEDDWQPKNAYKGLIYVSMDTSIATVDAEGVVTGVRPGDVEILVFSAIDPEVQQTVTCTITDELKSEYDVAERETNAILAQVPAYVYGEYTLPGPWNPTVQVTYKTGDGAIEKIPAVNKDTKYTISLSVIVGESRIDKNITVWAVATPDLNSYTRVNGSVDAAIAILSETSYMYTKATGYAAGTIYYNGTDRSRLDPQPTDDASVLAANAYVKNAPAQRIDADIVLPPVIFGCEMNWASTNPTVLTADGKFTRPLDDKPITLSVTPSYGEYSRSIDLEVIGKGYDADEKVAFILENGTLSHINGKSFNTSIVLPEFDNMFGAKLTYKSQDEAVYAHDGKLVAAPAEAKDVKFTVTVEYAISYNASFNFKKEVEITVKALPKNALSEKVEAAINASNLNKELHFAWGKVEGNLLPLPTIEGATFECDIYDIELEARVAEYPVSVFDIKDGKIKLDVQYLRYTQVCLPVEYTMGDDTVTVNYFVNVGVAPSPMVVMTGTWRSTAQKDSAYMSEEQGKYDLIGNVSYFDKKIGNVSEAFGNGYWSGYVFTRENFDGKLWQAYIMELMTVKFVDGADGVVVDYGNVTGGESGAGGNWGILYVNTTDKDVALEVGTYNASGTVYKDGTAINAAIGSRVNIAVDGYAPGFVADKDGNILFGSHNASGTDKLQSGMDDLRAVVGGKSYKVNDTFEKGIYNALTDEEKAKVVFQLRASDAIVEGEGETATTKYARDAILTQEQYDALNDTQKALVVSEYKVNTAFTKNVPNLITDSKSGVKVNYIIVPAGGYCMSWKYQFYGVGSPATIRAFCEPGAKIAIDKYDVHPLSSMDAESAHTQLDLAETYLEANKTVSAEAALIKARGFYEKLAGDTKADVFSAERLEDAEASCKAKIEEEIVAILAMTGEEETFINTLANLNARIDKLTTQLTPANKEEFKALFDTYAEIDLTINYDFAGGYAQGYYSANDKDKVMPKFFKDLYEFLLEENAFKKKVSDGEIVDDPDGKVPTLEEFSTNSYWADIAALGAVKSVMSSYLFMPMFVGDVENSNYRDVIEGAHTFVNTEKGNKWIELFDFVDEATRYANGAGQDLWGRKGKNYEPYSLLAKQPYYTQAMYKDPSAVVVTNSGSSIGTLRFAQWVAGSILSSVYNGYIPHNVYKDTFDRQYTQENYSRQIYHCTDLEVVLQEAPYRAGYTFAGWVFVDGEDAGKPAVIKGEMFKDVNVVAKWVFDVEGPIEKVVEKDLTGVFYASDTTGKYTSATVPGTILEQDARVGIGEYTIVVGDKFFPLPFKSLIEIAKDATAPVTLSEKAQLQVYGTDGSTQNSTGLVYDSLTGKVKPTNSYGHGALYLNAGTFDATVTLENTYGRNLAGDNYGYQRYLFSPKEGAANVYTGKMVGVTGTCVVKPGEFLWCPMTAERFCTGLTDCNGTSGVAGVLSDGVEVMIFKNELVPAVEFFSVVFKDGSTFISEQYPLKSGDLTLNKPADLIKEGYDFVGWNTDPEATTALEIPATISENATYYAIWSKASKFDEVYVAATPQEGKELITFTTLLEAIQHTNPGGTVYISAGTYADKVVIEKSIKLIGPKATQVYSKNDTYTFDEEKEAVFTGGIDLAQGVNGVEIKGITLKNQVTLLGNENVNISNVVFNGVKYDSGLDGCVRVKGVSKDLVLNNILFDTSVTPRGVYINAKTTNVTVKNCVVADNVTGFYDFVRFGQGNTECDGGTITLTNNYVRGVQSGIMVRMPSADKYVITNNYFKGVPAAVYFRPEPVANIDYNIAYNTFDGCGDKVADWDVVAVTTSSTTNVHVNYNAFLDCFPTEGTKVDYVIKIRTDAGQIDCANNYFAQETFKTENQNAKGLTFVDSNPTIFTIADCYNELIHDFYAYCKGDNAEFESFETFKGGFDTNWKAGNKYGTYDDKFYAANKANVIDDSLNTFANSTAYAAKWMGFFNALDAIVKDVNPTQSSWASPYTGLIRLRNYFGKGTYSTSYHDQLFITALQEAMTK